MWFCILYKTALYKKDFDTIRENHQSPIAKHLSKVPRERISLLGVSVNKKYTGGRKWT